MPLKFLGQGSGSLPRVDRYELIAEIASGGMATVFLARVVGVGGFERFFAIKRLHPHLGNEEGFVSMFLDEARIVAGIRHPHVVPVLEVGASEQGYYLVMEYIEGEPLGTFIGRGIKHADPIPHEVVIRILLDTLAGLHAAHEHVDPDGNSLGLVHRDVSPQNILVDINGIARIADFGVAHATSRMSSTRSGQLKGKVAYMAPEQARGQTVTPRSDVFAAGIVLWEALCERRLFLAENEAVTLNGLLFEPIPSPRQVNPRVPAPVEKVVMRSLQRDPAKRYGSAADMSDDLQVAARAGGILGTRSDVKTYVRNVIGVAMEHRRASVRDHLARIGAFLPVADAASGSLGTAPSRPDIRFAGASDSSVSSAAVAVPTPLSSPTSSAEIGSPFEKASTSSRRRFATFVAGAAAVGLLAIGGIRWALGNASTPVPVPHSASPATSPPATFDKPMRKDAAPEAAMDAATATAEDLPLAPKARSREPDTNGVKAPPPQPTLPSSPATTPTAASTAPPAAASTTKATPAGTTHKKPPATDDDLKRNPYR